MVYQFFPRSQGTTEEINRIVACFEAVKDEIDSIRYPLVSNAVLAKLRPHFEKEGFIVETGKTQNAKIPVPVLFGENNSIEREFNADAVSKDGRIVIEVEAGGAVDNNKYLKCIFQASLMFEVEYLVLAVKKIYRKRMGGKITEHRNYEKVYSFLETLYISNRLKLPLTGILLIGY